MGVVGGSNIATPSSLGFSLDQYNSKSQKGKASINVVLNQNLHVGWSQGYTEGIEWNLIDPPVGITAPVVSFHDDGTGSGYWYSYGNHAPQANSTQYSYSVYVKTTDKTGLYLRMYTADNSESDRVTLAYKYFTPEGETNSSYVLLTGADENLADERGWVRLEWDNAFTTDSDCDSDSVSHRYGSLQSDPHIERLYLCAPQLEANDVCTPYVPVEDFANQLTRKQTPTSGYNLTSVRGNALYNLVTSDATATENVTFLGDNTITFASGDNFQTGDISYPSTFADPFSIECWIYHDSSNTWANSYRGRLVARGSYAGSHGLWRHNAGNGVVSAWVRSGGTSKERTTTLNDNAWNHVVMTWANDSLLAIYKNGELGQSYAPGDLTADVPDTGTWIVGGSGAASGASGSNYIGKMAKVRIYKTALTANQVKQNYAASRGHFGL